MTWDYDAGDFIDPMMTKVDSALGGKSVDFAAFIWMQGESDVNLKLQDTYEAALSDVIETVRDKLAYENMPVVIARGTDWRVEDEFMGPQCVVRNA